MSTGLVATTMMPSGFAWAMCGTICPKMAAFRFTRSSRVSPGFWFVPAAMTVIATKPALMLFLLVVAYAVSGYVHWALGKRPRRIV